MSNPARYSNCTKNKNTFCSNGIASTEPKYHNTQVFQQEQTNTSCLMTP